jgi:hypothetical protein
VYIIAKQMLFVNIKRGNTNDTLRTTRKRNDYNGYDFRCFAFYHDLWLCNFIACNMSSLTISINDLDIETKAKIFDLFILVDVIPHSTHNPLNNTHSIEIAINENDGRALDGVMTYIMKYIVKN